MMNMLLILFALPVAVIIVSIALQKILDNPALVASIIFSVFLVTTFVVGNLNLLVATIIYTIISFVTAVLVNYIRNNNCSLNSESTNQNENNVQNQCRRYR